MLVLTAPGVDITPPTVTGCPANIVETIPVGQASTAVTWTPPTATDNVTPPSQIIVISTHNPGANFNVGVSTTVMYIFRDEAGNENTQCYFTITVEGTDLRKSFL